MDAIVELTGRCQSRGREGVGTASTAVLLRYPLPTMSLRSYSSACELPVLHGFLHCWLHLWPHSWLYTQRTAGWTAGCAAGTTVGFTLCSSVSPQLGSNLVARTPESVARSLAQFSFLKFKTEFFTFRSGLRARRRDCAPLTLSFREVLEKDENSASRHFSPASLSLFDPASPACVRSCFPAPAASSGGLQLLLPAFRCSPGARRQVRYRYRLYQVGSGEGDSRWRCPSGSECLSLRTRCCRPGVDHTN